jgi:hypothetical protein
VLVDLTSSGEALRERIRVVPDRIKTACQIPDERADELRDVLNGIGRSDDD